MDYLDKLASFAAEVRYESLDKAVQQAAKRVVMDTIGAILGGSSLSENSSLARFASTASGHVGPSTILGQNVKAQPMLAALSNATSGVSLEMDEGTRLGGGHPAIHVLPGALAVAEEMGVSGVRLMEGLVAGYEVCSRIGGATVVRSNVHSHGTWGTIGTAVAVARIMECGQQEMKDVINIASSMSPANTWTPCFEGATIRNVYPGRSGMQGILAVHLEKCGFTGLSDAPSDVYGTILGSTFDPVLVVDGLGDQNLRIEQNYFKFHACCLYNHPILDAVQDLISSQDVIHDQIDQITVTTVPFAERMAQGYPRNMLSAKFHIPYAVAALLVTGHVDISVFEQDVLDDPRIYELVQRIRVCTDPNMDMQRAERPCALVDIALQDGRVLTSSSTFVYGDFRNPRSCDDLTHKFESLSEGVISKRNIGVALRILRELDVLNDVRDLTCVLSGE